MSDAISSFGTLLQLGDGATPTEVFTTIAEVRDITGPGMGMNTAEVTNHSSPGGFDEHVGTILKGGEVSFDINYIPGDATHDETTGLLSSLLDRQLHNFQLVFPTTTPVTWSFSALVTAFEPSEPVDGELSASITLLISGQPAFA